MNNNILYNKVFTGEIKPVIINKDTPNVTIDGSPTEPDTTFPITETWDCTEVALIRWRDIVKKHLPSNANLATVEAELKLEYLHCDYLIPSRVVVPSSAIPDMARRESNLQKQVKTLEFKNKYNQSGNYAFEFRLLKLYDSNYKLNSITLYKNQIPFDVGLNYPIADLIYNNRLPGFIDLMPYLIKNGTLIFADIKQELRVQINPKLGVNDLLIFGGGYSGSVTFELLPKTTQITKSESIVLTGSNPVLMLDHNPKRYGFYLCNNGNFNIYYNFTNNAPISNSARLTLKPGDTLIYEDNKLSLNNAEINPGDNRLMLGCRLWARNSQPLDNRVSIEEISYP
jgi:hypothetical protein